MNASLLRRAPAVLLAVAVGLGAAGCSADGESGGSAGNTGYISGRGTVTTIDVDERRALPDEVSGETLDGEPISLADFEGKTVVVNVWGSWCADCRAEAADLVSASKALADQDVVFLGIDSRDPSRAAAQAYVRRFDIPYPSIYDATGKVLLAFRGTLTPNSIPSTVIVDSEGRVAARVLGGVSEKTLVGLVEDVSS